MRIRFPITDQQTFDFDAIPELLTPDEMYAKATDASILQRWSEDRRIERKPPGYQPRPLGDYVSMWANTAPDGGLIVVGMEDKGQVSGCHNLSINQVNEIEKAPHIYCPDARFDSKRIPGTTPDGQQTYVIVFRVKYNDGKVVHTSEGKAFIRRGDEKHTLTTDEIRELAIDRGEAQFEEEPVNLIYPEDFNMDLVRIFTDNFRLARRAPDLTDINVLALRYLGRMERGNFRPNNACALLFSKDPNQLFPGCKVRFLRFDGEVEGTGENYNVVKSEFIEGPIYEVITETAKILDSQLRQFSRLGKDGHFTTVPEYPQEAWFEALVNACVHRSYSLRNMNVFVKMFDDHLEFESPGGFPPLVTPENIYDTPNPRNPRLMNALYYMDITREHNEGTKRMRKAMAGLSLPPPEFRQTQAGGGFVRVKVTLRNEQKQRKSWVDADAGKILGESIASTLSTEERMVVNYLAVNGTINVSQCLRHVPTCLRWHNAKDLLMRMHARGVLQHHTTGVPRGPQCWTLPGVASPSLRPVRRTSFRRRSK